MGDTTSPALRELFIDELTQVQGGGPVEDVLDHTAIDDWLFGNTTQACCEEGPDNCC